MKRYLRSKQKTGAKTSSGSKLQSELSEKSPLKFKEYLPVLFVVFTLLTFSVLFWPIKRIETTISSLDFASTQVKSEDYELGESVTIKEGQKGERITKYLVKTNLFKSLFGLNNEKIEISSGIAVNPVDEVTTLGTRKYQYMLCSDGSYRFYSDDQFKNPNTGFTSKSEDSCAKNNNGTKVRLADDPNGRTGKALQANPNGNQAISRPGCSKINIVKPKTTYRKDANLEAGERWTFSPGSEGYTFSCPSSGIKSVVPATDAIIYVGTGETAQKKEEQERIRSEQEAARQQAYARQQWLTCAQSVRSQVSAINGGDPTAAINHLCGRQP